VTAFDSDSASEPEGGAGHFPVVLRGYDRQLVDTRLGELAGQLEQERRERADTEQRLHQFDGGNALAVRDQPTASFLSLGAKAAKVFEEAGAVAEQLIGEAQEQARAIIDAAQAEAAERLEAAEEQASELEQAARQTLTEAEADQARIEAEAAEAAEALLADADRDAEAERAAAREEIRRAGTRRTVSGSWWRPRPSGSRRFARSWLSSLPRSRLTLAWRCAQPVTAARPRADPM
jgi:hypothetical protein